MKSIKFPDMLTSSSVNVVSDHDASLQNLKLLLYSNKGELFGDPYYGTSLLKYLYEQNDAILQDILIDDIYSAIATFMPQIIVQRNSIKIEASLGKITATIKAINRSNFQFEEFNLVLLESDAIV